MTVLFSPRKVSTTTPTDGIGTTRSSAGRGFIVSSYKQIAPTSEFKRFFMGRRSHIGR